MEFGGVAALAASAGSKALAVSIALIGVLRFIRWAVPFVCERLDLRADRLEARERNLERRMNLRLKHVEIELDRYREATMLLVNALAERDPTNRALSDVARILRKTMPLEPMTDELSDLIDELGQVPGTKEKRQ